jgi:aerotaxis receptor
MVEELSAAASSLQAQARVMNDAVKFFRVENRKQAA